MLSALPPGTLPDAVMIELRNLTKAYGGKPALHGLSLKVRRGEIFGLLGHNGAGKSTTLGILLGQVFPDQGEALIGGVSVQRERARALARTGAIFEAPRFYDYLSGWRNLEIYTSYSARVPAKRIEEAVEIAGLTGRIHDRVGTYSQGMRQRLGLAQALLPENEVILLDEPTNGLDPEGIHEMRELIQRLNREHGLTVVFCSHLLVEVEQLCDHVVILNQGRKIFDGRWADLAVDRRRVRLDVDDWDRAKALLSEAEGVLVEGVGMISLDENCEIADLVARLVHGGVRVSAVEPQRRSLEQIYLSLTHPVAEAIKS
jgi:ABC-2 type transport system ATP-binding protein